LKTAWQTILLITVVVGMVVTTRVVADHLEQTLYNIHLTMYACFGHLRNEFYGEFHSIGV